MSALHQYKVMNALLENTIRTSGRDSVLVGTHLQQLLFSLIKSGEITKFIEIGAFEGTFSRTAKKLYPNADVIAFEANPYVYEKFSDLLKSHGIDYRLNCVTDKKGPVKISVPKDYRGSEKPKANQMGSILKNVSTENFETVKVDGVVLDTELKLTQKDRLVMWVDVEGATEMVFKGCQKLLKKTVFLHIEVESRPVWEGQWLDGDVFNALSKKGFVPIARDIQGYNQFNYIYVNSALFDSVRFNQAYFRFLTGTGEFSS